MNHLTDFNKAQAAKILGCYNVDIIKSEGNGVLGQTKSGKPIQTNPEQHDHSDFSRQDHHDAIVQHNINGNQAGADYHRNQANAMAKSDDETDQMSPGQDSNNQ